MENVLRASHERRLKRIQRQVAVLCSDNGVAPVSPAAPSVAASGATSLPSVAVQTEDVEAKQRLVRAMERSLQSADAASRTPPKIYGPSGRQRRLLDPQEEKVDGLVSETTCMKGTLEQLDISIISRERQIAALQSQLETCKNMEKEQVDATSVAAAALRELVANSASVPRVHEERLHKRQQRVAKLRQDLHRNRQKATHYRALAQQQRHYYLQNERTGNSGAADRLQRHPAGEIFLVPRPPSLGDMKAEVFDIGTAIANPYVCDSWPFEPNVLASRTSKEATMQACIEETPEDFEEERKRLPFLQLRLPAPGRGCDDEEDDFDDRYNGPSETARSL